MAVLFKDANNMLSLSNLSGTQKAFIASNTIINGIVGGYQSGKSTAAACKVVVHLLRFPNVPIAYYLPNYSLFNTMLVPKLASEFDNLGIKYTYRKKESELETSYGKIFMRAMDNPDKIVSYSVGYSIVDEVDLVRSNIKDDVMARISGRNSFKKGGVNQIDFVCTPEGFGYMYNYFIVNNNKNKSLFRLKTLDNASNISEQYIQGLREQYDENQLKAYINGEFVNLKDGLVYNRFSREHSHASIKVEKGEQIHIGVDFNIGNMNAVCFVSRSGVKYAVDELTGFYDTVDLCTAVKSKYERTNPVIFYPDASAASRRTNGVSDVDIISRKFGYTVRKNNRNPFVRDRVNAVNIELLSKKTLKNNELVDVRRLYVDTEKCKKLTIALEALNYDKRTNEPDKKSGFDHITDAFGYYIAFESIGTTTLTSYGPEKDVSFRVY